MKSDSTTRAAAEPSGFKLRRKNRQAFTLVEIVMVIGIITVAFVPLLGILPVGLNLSRQAIDTTVVSQIAQQLISQAQQTDFSMLSSLETTYTSAPESHAPGGPFYFDEQGNRTTNATGAIYEAGFQVTTTTALPTGSSTQKLATVMICILNRTARRTTQETNLARNADAKKYSALIPDNGR